jgi:hypothetical protein
MRRAFYVIFGMTCAALLAAHLGEVRWLRFAVAFLLIDLIGYLPGARAQRRAGRRPIAPHYHHLYNLTHSFLTVAAVAALWALGGGLEWAMLAMPLHLSIDRGLLGNFHKPIGRLFEEVPA